MPTVKIRYKDVHSEIIGYEDTDGTPVEMEETVIIPTCIPVDQVSTWLAAYDSSNQYSPSAADSRVIARAVLDALKKHQE
jgi:hypothetical protein|tara:strand:- start:158 stop:397 length:240 start_codon:yes stop_codon:yes gene_type:complete